MRIASIQLEMADRPKGQNVEHALSMVDRVSPADLILLPEIWPCGFFAFDRYAADSEPLDGPTVNAFRQKARERRCHILMGSLVERDADGLFNTTVFIGPAGEIVARYRKIHLFGYQSDETKLLTPGKEIVVTDTPWGRAGFSTCYDLRFPELFRRMVDGGRRSSSSRPHGRWRASRPGGSSTARGPTRTWRSWSPATAPARTPASATAATA